MRRREFLKETARAAAGCGALRFVTRAQSKTARAWTTLIADLEKMVPQQMAEANVPGVSIAVIRGGKLAWRLGFGVKDIQSKSPVDNDTVFEAASMSKPVFAYAAMKLCERGVIGLDIPLTKYTPERYLEGDPRLELITARHVLSHTSGFQNYRSVDEPLSIHFTPGEKYLYSGEGYIYLQSIVTHLTGHVNPNQCAGYERGLQVCATDIDSYMKRNLLVPFAMNSSGYLWSGTFEKRTARPHDLQGRPLTKKKPTATDAARYAAPGGLHTTPTDYARFLIETINPRASDAYRLSKASLDEMVRPQVKVSEGEGYSISWGLGWRIAHTKIGDLISHGGDNEGFHCIAEASIQRKTGFVIMTNADTGVELLKKLAPVVSERLHAL